MKPALAHLVTNCFQSDLKITLFVITCVVCVCDRTSMIGKTQYRTKSSK